MVITVSGAPLITVLVTSLLAKRWEFGLVGLEVLSLDITIQIQLKSWFEKGNGTLSCC